MLRVDMIDYDKHITRESARFAAAIQAAGGDVLSTTVPSCPDWRIADLVWHLAEVQDFWGHILSGDAEGPETYDRPDRPADIELVEFLIRGTSRLTAALRQPDENTCWSWAATGGTVGWVRRRQAQEALIHRIDVELAVNDLTPVDQELAGDGVDEILEVMLDIGELPRWATFTPDDELVVLDAGERWWSVHLGRFTGTPTDGDPLDLPALSLEADGIGSGADVACGTRIVATAGDLNLWLWGRTGDNVLDVIGDADAATRLRATAADATK